MTGRNWAITVGINRYKNLQALQFAKQDAESMQQYLGEELGCRPVYHFADDSPPIPQDYGPDLDSQPTFATLRRFLRVRFEEPFLKAGDNLWFFFAGHGIRHEDRDYLMPIDGDPGDIESTAIPLHYVTERLQRCGADNVILLIDACRSDSGRRDGLGIGQERHPGVITFFSCSPKESSYEIDELQHGAFTHALLEGLKLHGEGNCATVERLYHHLSQTVPRLSQHYGKPPQTPYGRIEPPTKNSLILLPRQATLADVKELKYSATNAEVRRNYPLAKQFWIRVLAVSPADPEAIEGIERLVQVAATPQPATQVTEAKTETGRGVEAPAKAASSQTPPPVPQDYRVEQFVPPSSVKPPTPKAGPRYEFEVVTVNAQGQISQREQRSAEYRREDLGRGISLDLVPIPGGTFTMGSPATEAERLDTEGPQHQVTIQPFLIGKYPVTQAQWKAVAALPKVKLDLDADPARFKGDNLPVEKVSWDAAVEFCQRLSKQTGREYRLPSEAEWEYTCRAGTTTPFHFGETITTDLANYNGSYTYGSGPKGQSRGKTTAVGSFKIANAVGLYDMHGNVWEWCLDYWHENYQGAPTDGSAWTTGGDDTKRLLRGGSWGSYPGNCRSAYRSRFARDNQDYIVGFRLVCASSWAL
jgi:formylglycine-generating enzyme required for sulfatase activity/uncharacterized caspase-like protein